MKLRYVSSTVLEKGLPTYFDNITIGVLFGVSFKVNRHLFEKRGEPLQWNTVLCPLVWELQ